MIQTSRADLEAALYGVSRLIAGYKDWKDVENLPNSDKISRLVEITATAVSEQSKDPLNVDPKLQGQLMRKLRGYQQLSVIENFVFQEVDWN